MHDYVISSVQKRELDNQVPDLNREFANVKQVVNFPLPKMANGPPQSGRQFTVDQLNSDEIHKIKEMGE